MIDSTAFFVVDIISLVWNGFNNKTIITFVEFRDNLCTVLLILFAIARLSSTTTLPSVMKEGFYFNFMFTSDFINYPPCFFAVPFSSKKS